MYTGNQVFGTFNFPMIKLYAGGSEYLSGVEEGLFLDEDGQHYFQTSVDRSGYPKYVVNSVIEIVYYDYIIRCFKMKNDGVEHFRTCCFIVTNCIYTRRVYNAMLYAIFDDYKVVAGKKFVSEFMPIWDIIGKAKVAFDIHYDMYYKCI